MDSSKKSSVNPTFAFAEELQKFAKEQHVKVYSFKTKERHSPNRGNYDVLTVSFSIPRPDRDGAAPIDLDKEIDELEKELRKDEVKNNEI